MIQKDHAEAKRATAFTEAEATYLAENFLGRLATATREGEPHVVPVSYRFDGKAIVFGGWNLASSRKYRQLMANHWVAFVVDDIASTNPWRVRGVEVRGTAEPIAVNGVSVVRIIPLNIRSWGLGS
ncbi:MAG TPA: PPOX class F420-dependent oxidoreductase [Nitrososphaerales archaeon]|nr:PPOX class F420-dependent oxidoreductase [Nitrososphaerales archaeon]